MVVYIVAVAQCMVRALAAHFRDPHAIHWQFQTRESPGKTLTKTCSGSATCVACPGNLAALKLPGFT